MYIPTQKSDINIVVQTVFNNKKKHTKKKSNNPINLTKYSKRHQVELAKTSQHKINKRISIKREHLTHLDD